MLMVLYGHGQASKSRTVGRDSDRVPIGYFNPDFEHTSRPT